jgi:hypothetical protein
MWSVYTLFGGVPEVGSCVNPEWRLVQIGRRTQYACSVKSETIKVNRIVYFRCGGTWFLSEEILGLILSVSLEYTRCVSGYDISTTYRIDSLSIPAWLDINCTVSGSGESRSWERFSCAIDFKLFNIVISGNVANLFMTQVSGEPAIDKQQMSGITRRCSGETENTDLVRWFRYLPATWTIYDDHNHWLQRRQILRREYTARQIVTLSSITLVHLLFVT